MRTGAAEFDTIVDENKPSAVRVLRVEGPHPAKGGWDMQSGYPPHLFKWTVWSIFLLKICKVVLHIKAK